jgi:hypothetical protein
VIYDPDLLAHFVRTLEILSEANPECRILVAGQERNPETLSLFLNNIGEKLGTQSNWLILESSQLRLISTTSCYTENDSIVLEDGSGGKREIPIVIAPNQALENIKLFEICRGINFVSLYVNAKNTHYAKIFYCLLNLDY